jgi:hypothetical protein
MSDKNKVANLSIQYQLRKSAIEGWSKSAVYGARSVGSLNPDARSITWAASSNAASCHGRPINCRPKGKPYIVI